MCAAAHHRSRAPGPPVVSPESIHPPRRPRPPPDEAWTPPPREDDRRPRATGRERRGTSTREASRRRETTDTPRERTRLHRAAAARARGARGVGCLSSLCSERRCVCAPPRVATTRLGSRERREGLPGPGAARGGGRIAAAVHRSSFDAAHVSVIRSSARVRGRASRRDGDDGARRTTRTMRGASRRRAAPRWSMTIAATARRRRRRRRRRDDDDAHAEELVRERALDLGRVVELVRRDDDCGRVLLDDLLGERRAREERERRAPLALVVTERLAHRHREQLRRRRQRRDAARRGVERSGAETPRGRGRGRREVCVAVLSAYAPSARARRRRRRRKGARFLRTAGPAARGARAGRGEGGGAMGVERVLVTRL